VSWVPWMLQRKTLCLSTLMSCYLTSTQGTCPLGRICLRLTCFCTCSLFKLQGQSLSKLDSQRLGFRTAIQKYCCDSFCIIGNVFRIAPEDSSQLGRNKGQVAGLAITASACLFFLFHAFYNTWCPVRWATCTSAQLQLQSSGQPLASFMAVTSVWSSAYQ